MEDSGPWEKLVSLPASRAVQVSYRQALVAEYEGQETARPPDVSPSHRAAHLAPVSEQASSKPSSPLKYSCSSKQQESLK